LSRKLRVEPEIRRRYFRLKAEATLDSWALTAQPAIEDRRRSERRRQSAGA
jgi:hypothetical protein